MSDERVIIIVDSMDFSLGSKDTKILSVEVKYLKVKFHVCFQI